MSTTTFTIERTPVTLHLQGRAVPVVQLGTPLPFARKPMDLEDMSAGEACIVYITETRDLTPGEFDNFAANLLTSRDWLRGKGGYLNEGRLCVEVVAPGRPTLFVDPSGGDYARYVARLG